MSSQLFTNPEFILDLKKTEWTIESISKRFYVPYSVIKLFRESIDSEQELNSALQRIEDLESSISQLTSLSKIMLEKLKRNREKVLIETQSLDLISIKSKNLKSKADILPYVEKLKDLVKNLNELEGRDNNQVWGGSNNEKKLENGRFSSYGCIDVHELEESESEEFEQLISVENEDEVESTVNDLIGKNYKEKFTILQETLNQDKEKGLKIQQLEAERDELSENVEHLESKIY